MNTSNLAPALTTLFGELINGPTKEGAFVLNPGDVGLLKSLDKIDAREASHGHDGGAPIAAHVAHARYGLSLMNRWAAGEANPFESADWSTAWQIKEVTDTEWQKIRGELREECELWLSNLDNPRDVIPIELNGVIASVVHLGYHMGAMRQISAALRGPRDEESHAASGAEG
jgi:hypothetical protein